MTRIGLRPSLRPSPLHLRLCLPQVSELRAESLASRIPATEQRLGELQGRASTLQSALSAAEDNLEQCRREKRDLTTQLAAANGAQEQLRREAAGEAHRLHSDAEVCVHKCACACA